MSTPKCIETLRTIKKSIQKEIVEIYSQVADVLALDAQGRPVRPVISVAIVKSTGALIGFSVSSNSPESLYDNKNQEDKDGTLQL